MVTDGSDLCHHFTTASCALCSQTAGISFLNTTRTRSRPQTVCGRPCPWEPTALRVTDGYFAARICLALKRSQCQRVFFIFLKSNRHSRPDNAGRGPLARFDRARGLSRRAAIRGGIAQPSLSSVGSPGILAGHRTAIFQRWRSVRMNKAPFVTAYDARERSPRSFSANNSYSFAALTT